MSRRKNGEGTYDKTTINGTEYFRWRGCLGVDPGTGRTIRKSLFAKTEKDLRAKVRDIMKSLERGSINAPKHLTVAAWLQQWLDECCSDVKERTRNTYRSSINTRIIPALGAVRLSDLTPGMIQQFVNGLTDVSPKTVKNLFGILHEALKKAVQWNLINSNPAGGIALPRIEKHEVGFLAGDDLKRFLVAIEGNEYADAFRLAVFTGMREGELLGLCWDTVDFQRQTITVRQQLQLIRGHYVIVSTKNDKTRTLSPAPFVFDILKRVRAEQNVWRLKMSADWNDEHDFVFTRYDGRNVARNTLFMNFKRCLEKAGLPTSYRFHDLRHSYAVFSLEAGDDLKQIQSSLGHYSAAFTADTYAHVSEQAKKASAARQQAAFEALIHG